MQKRKQPITIKNPACYDLDPYIGAYVEYTSTDEPGKVYSGHIERSGECGEAMVHDDAEPWVYVFTGTIDTITIFA